MEKDLICVAAHLDDIEISFLGYIFNKHINYDSIKIIIVSNWDNKVKIWNENCKLIEDYIGKKIDYINLNFSQREFFNNFDLIKDKIYNKINFNKKFDIITHDENDCHTDHFSLNKIMKGLYKHCHMFMTVYSPSSSNFNPNFWIGLNKDQYNLKKIMCDKYMIKHEQSYSKSGYYLQSEDHYNIGKSYYLENFVFSEHNSYECYKLIKWLE